MKKHLAKLIMVGFLAIGLLSFNQSCEQSKQQPTKIKNTNQFISYFKGLQNVADYKKQKDTIEKLGVKIKFSTTISQSNKDQLKEYYDKVKATSDELFDKIITDLTDQTTRSTIVKNPQTYVDSLNKRFQTIKNAEKDFFDDYTQIVGEPQGKGAIVLIWLIKKFLLPLAEAFVTEVVIPDVIKSQLNKRLKPVIVIKSWEQLSQK